MPPAKPGPAREAMEQQDQSIKSRKSVLFEPRQLETGPAARPFVEYLRETPAAPLSPVWRGTLWALAALVGLLLIASLAKGRFTSRSPAKPDASASAPAEAETDGRE